MADLKFQSNPSGTGVFTVQPPNSNTNRTITLPDNEGEILTSATTTLLPKGVPAFKAALNANQGIAHNTTVVPNYTVEDFDIGGFYDATTRRFQPTIAGYYHFTHRWVATIFSSRNYYFLNGIRKNAVTVATVNSTLPPVTLGLEFGLNTNTILYLNGSTDFVEPVIYQFDYTGSGTISLSAGVFSEFSGFLVSAT